MRFSAKVSFRSVILAAVMVAILAINGFAFAAVNGDTVSLTVLTVNDFHGALADKGAGKDPGAAKLAAFLLTEKAKNPTGTLIFSAGDMFQGTADSNLLYGKPVLDIMNYVGFDAMSIGNHEFDWGMEKLMDMKKQSKFAWGAANIRANGVVPGFARPVLLSPAPYMFFKRDGVTIGVIPLATPETAYKANPKIVGAYTFLNPSTVVKELAPKLRSQGAQIIMVLSHLGSSQDAATNQITGEAADLANALPAGSVDLIISGHTHANVAGYVNGIAIVQGQNNGRRVGEVSLNFSKSQNKVIKVLPIAEDLANKAGLTANSGAKAIVDKYAAAIAPIKNTILGKTTYDLTHDRYGNNVSLLGQWTTDVMRAAVNADFAFQNGGGLRTTIYAGNITVGHMYEVMPFDNTLNTVEMTGAQVLQVLEYGIKNPSIGMLQFSGAKVVFDSSRPSGSRVISVTMPDGSMINASKIYKVVTNDFMATGGDGYTMFKQGKNLTETGVAVRECLSEAVKKAGTITYLGDNRLVVR